MRVEPLSGGMDLQAFLRLPWSIYRGDPDWVPPLLHDQKMLLDREKHPFHQHAEVEYFLARRGERVVGRIAAIVNHLHVQFHDEKAGFFGFFECEDDPEAAAALLDAAEAYVADRGMRILRGPMNFSTNEECGLLVDGFHEPPFIMMTYNPRYYERLIEGTGFRKAKDLLAYELPTTPPPERLVRGTARIAERKGIRIRHADLSKFDEEVAVMEGIYNRAWESNWGFVPMTHEEFQVMAKQLKPVAEPRYILFAEVRGSPIAFGIGLPDFNQALRHIDGRLLPFGIFKLLWYRRKIDQVRVLTLGVEPGYRRLGIDAMLYLEFYRQALADGTIRGECSWILEDNWEMRRALEQMGAVVYKTYRIYDRAVGGAG